MQYHKEVFLNQFCFQPRSIQTDEYKYSRHSVSRLLDNVANSGDVKCRLGCETPHWKSSSHSISNLTPWYMSCIDIILTLILELLRVQLTNYCYPEEQMINPVENAQHQYDFIVVGNVQTLNIFITTASRWWFSWSCCCQSTIRKPRLESFADRGW